MEVDYTEKLNFSDDDENQASKDKGENWSVFTCELFCQQMKCACHKK